MCLEYFEGLLDQVAKVQSLALRVIDLVSQVHVLGLVEVEHRQDLSVVGYEGFTDGVGAHHQCLEHFQSDLDDLDVAGVQCGYSKGLTKMVKLTFDRDDQLGDDREDFSATLFEHVEGTLD